MKNRKRMVLWSVCTLALVGCHATYDIDRFEGCDNTYVFARPQNFVLIGTKSTAEWLEIIEANQVESPNGSFRVEIALRNKGGTGFFTWMQKSHDITIYARVDFYSQKDGCLIKSVPRQAVVLPLGDTIHFSQEIVDPRVKFARVILFEK